MDVETLSRDLHVSNATIRRDLDQLAHQQLLTRTRGGAVVNNVSYDLPLRYKTARHAPEKQRIGQAAAALVPRRRGRRPQRRHHGHRGRSRARDPLGPGRLAGDTRAVTVVTNALNIA